MLTIPGTTATGTRIPEFNAEGLPASVALTLAQRKLARLNSPPRQVRISIPYLDLRVRRGSVVRVLNRAGVSLGNYFVEGVTQTFASLGTESQRVGMSLEARQLL